jgi:hypothetical protein
MTATFQPAGFSAILIGDESLTIACGDMILAGGHAITTLSHAMPLCAAGPRGRD